MGRFDPRDNTFSYIVGVLARPAAAVPAGMMGLELPAVKYAVGTIEGSEPDIYIQAHALTEGGMRQAGLSFDTSAGYEMEWYDERFMKDEDARVIDLYVPAV